MDAEKLIEEATEIAAQTATQGDLESEYPPCNCSAPPRGHTMRQHDYRRLQVDELRAVLDVVSRMTAALRETTARADRQKQQFDEALGDLMDAHAEEIRKRGLSNAVTAETYDACHAALRQTEEERDRERKRADVLAAANLAANKRIEALEHERDAARAELARLTTPSGEPLDMDCGDNCCMFAAQKGGMRTNGGCRCLESLGFRRGPHDALRKMAAEIVAMRKRLSDLTTPRPIAEAPRDGTWILGCWPESNEWLPIVMHWTGKEWQREDPAERDEGYMPTHFLPLPVLP